LQPESTQGLQTTVKADQACYCRRLSDTGISRGGFPQCIAYTERAGFSVSVNFTSRTQDTFTVFYRH